MSGRDSLRNEWKLWENEQWEYVRQEWELTDKNRRYNMYSKC